MEAFIAFKPWEVTATETTLTICNIYRYKKNRRCRLGYEYHAFDLKEEVWVKKNEAELISSLKRIKYFGYGQYTTFRNICSGVAEYFINTKISDCTKNSSLNDRMVAEILFKSYSRNLYKNHSYKSYQILEWFKKTSKTDFVAAVKIGFKVGHFTAGDLATLRLDTLLANNSLNYDSAVAFSQNNPDFLALYINLNQKDRDQKITPAFLNEGVRLNIHSAVGVQLRVHPKQFNKFKNLGTSIVKQYMDSLRTAFEITSERFYRHQTHESHVIRHIEHQSLEILFFINGLHVELGFKKPHCRFINRFTSKIMFYILRRSNNLADSKHNIKTMYHAFCKLMYGNFNSTERNKYIGRSNDYNDLNNDLDTILDYLNDNKTVRLDKRASISGIKTKAQEWIDEKNKLRMEAQKQSLISKKWLPRIIQSPLVFNECMFSEITNLYDLYLEGNAMHHCVYHNYKDEVHEGHVTVFKVQHTQNETESSTLGLVQESNGKYQILQNYGSYNREPSASIKKAVQSFLRKINKSIPA